ncbi:SLAM family member 5-like isoform X2 [Rhinoraja longicauda]
MEISESLNSNVFKLASVLNLIVVCGGALYARPEAIVNTTSGQTVMFPIERQGQEEQYDVTFGLRFPLNFKILTWQSNNPGKLHIVHPRYEHRATIRHESVVLDDVQVDDSGEYQIRINYFGSEVKNHDQSTFGIHVFDPVSKPIAETLIHGQNAFNITLNCSVANENNVTIYWEKISQSGAIIETYAKTIVIDCSTEEEQYEYRCIAKNPVSNASSSELSINECDVRNWNVVVF